MPYLARYKLIVLRLLTLGSLVAFVLLGGCNPLSEVTSIEPTYTHSVLEETSQPAGEPPPDGLSDLEIKTLASLRKVDDYPLYSMHYYGVYGTSLLAQEEHDSAKENQTWEVQTPFLSAWACSLFTALGDDDSMVFGRNFDWDYSPALLLVTDPDDGYASVSMVDIAYLGFTGERANMILDLPLEERSALLKTPHLPFDGMNEYGLVVGMAAVPAGNMAQDPGKPTIGSLGVMREMLDHARDVSEAITIFQSYNIDFGKGPPIHYLIADASGHAVLIEFYQGEQFVIFNEEPWHLATNFLRAGMVESSSGVCWRYDRIESRLSETGGILSPLEALDLLQSVSQAGTQWSVLYGINDHEVRVVMGKAYERVHAFRFRDEIDW